jgi:tetratricopeptide (TPR) repeat protein
MTQGLNLQSIELLNGAIVGCSGFVQLLGGISGERQFSLTEWAALAEGEGADSDQALKDVARALCGAALAAEKAGDWMINFVPSGDDQKPAVEVPETLCESLSVVLRDAIDVNDVRSWFEGAAMKGLETAVLDGSDSSKWGLVGREQRLFEHIGKDGSVGALFMEVGSDGWPSLGVLWHLGLVKIAGESIPEGAPVQALSANDDDSEVLETEEEPVAADPEAQSERRKDDRRADRNNRDVPRRSGDERRRRDRRAGSSSTKGNAKRRRIDPRRVALKRAPHESDPELVETHLQEAYEVLRAVSPEFIFRLRKQEQLQRTLIEQRYHRLVTRYHPDRYLSQTQAVKSLAEGCFTAVSDAFHRLQDPAYAEELRIRIVEKETGKKVVTDKTRATSKVDFAKADALFKQKRYANAYELANRALEGDPDRWQYHYLSFRAGYRSGAVSIEEAEPGILGLQGMTTIEKADQIYTLGEMFLKNGDEKRAYKLFYQAVSLDEKNVGANRRLRLRDRREKESQKANNSGLFGGLFRGKKG